MVAAAASGPSTISWPADQRPAPRPQELQATALMKAVILLIPLASAACTSVHGPRTLAAGADVAPGACTASDAEPAFAFRSSFWLNLHNYLHQGSRRRADVDDDAPGARPSTDGSSVGVRSLTAAEANAWNAALDAYGQLVIARRLGDSVVTRINDRLGDVEDSAEPTAVPFEPMVQRVLWDVAPLYREVWWPLHDRTNRAWIDAARQAVRLYGGCVFARAARLLRRDWPTQPIRVDASVYATWFGAYASTAAGPRVTVASNAIGNLEPYGLETLLHEAIHASRLMRSVDSALTAESARRGGVVPGVLSHLVLFYTAGQLVRGVVPTHIPYAERFGIWRQNLLAQRMRAALDAHWAPYLRGERTFSEAIANVVTAPEVAQLGGAGQSQ